MLFWIKRHTMTDGGLLLAGCDKDLLGKSFEEGKKFLDVKASFYAQEEVNKEEFQDLAKRARVMNIIGEEIIAAADEVGLVNTDTVLRVDNIPHAQCVHLSEEK